MVEYEFKGKAYLEKSTLDKEGAEHTTFEFSVKQAIEHAKLKLMSRDVKSHLPVLLELRIRKAKVNGRENIKQKRQPNSQEIHR